MFRRLIAVLVMAGLAGCEAGSLTSPDEDDIAPLVQSVAEMPPKLRAWLESLKDLQAVEVMKNANPNRPVADIRCGPADEKKGVLTVKQLYHLLKDFVDRSSGGTPMYDSDVARMSFGEYLAGKLAEQGCRPDFEPYIDYTADWIQDPPPQGSYKANRDIANWLIALTALELSRRPALMAALGIATGAGGVMIALDGIGLLLCPRSASVKCPDDPGAPGVPQVGQGGSGER